MSGKTKAPKLVGQATTYQIVRDATVNDDSLSVSEKLGVLELVKQEILEQALHDLHRSAMNS